MEDLLTKPCHIGTDNGRQCPPQPQQQNQQLEHNNKDISSADGLQFKDRMSHAGGGLGITKLLINRLTHL